MLAVLSEMRRFVPFLFSLGKNKSPETVNALFSLWKLIFPLLQNVFSQRIGQQYVNIIVFFSSNHTGNKKTTLNLKCILL